MGTQKDSFLISIMFGELIEILLVSISLRMGELLTAIYSMVVFVTSLPDLETNPWEFH